MKDFITNKNHLTEEDITEVVERVKVLLINSNDEILLGYSDNQYQFIGGHIEEGESLLDTLNREMKEETGIELNVRNIDYFSRSIGYFKNHPSKGKNRKTINYYFDIYTDEKPNIYKTSYTENELSGDFELRYIKLKDFVNILNENTKEYGDKKGINREMLAIFNIYEEMKGLN